MTESKSVAPWGWKGVIETGRMHERSSWNDRNIQILIFMVITSIHSFIKVHQTIYLKWVHFTLCKLDFRISKNRSKYFFKIPEIWSCHPPVKNTSKASCCFKNKHQDLNICPCLPLWSHIMSLSSHFSWPNPQAFSFFFGLLSTFHLRLLYMLLFLPGMLFPPHSSYQLTSPHHLNRNSNVNSSLTPILHQVCLWHTLIASSMQKKWFYRLPANCNYIFVRYVD